MFVRSFAVSRAYFATRLISAEDILRRMKVGGMDGGCGDGGSVSTPVAGFGSMVGKPGGGDGGRGGFGGVGGGGDGSGASGGSGGGAGGSGDRNTSSPAEAAAAALHPATKLQPG